MQANIKLGRIWGIPIGINASWFLIFGLVTLSLATGYFPANYPELPVITAWIFGALATILLFASVLAHELGHAILAIRNNIPVRQITLFIFGGVAQITKEPATPGAEFRIAIAGPLTSLGLAGFFAALSALDQFVPNTAVPFEWLARTNLILAVFNLIPGFPLDGGRVFRALIWHLNGSFEKATRVASIGGQVVSYGFIGFGLLTILQGNFIGGVWFGFIGWYLQNAAVASYSQVKLQQNLRGLPVTEVMRKDMPNVPSHISLQEFANEFILGRQRTSFIVTDGEAVLGILTMQNLAGIPQKDWQYMTTAQAMVPLNELQQFDSNMDLMEAVTVLQEAEIQKAPVVNQGQIVGWLSQDDIFGYLRLKTELGG